MHYTFPQQELRHLPTFAKELLAGGVAGGLSKTCTAPLERVKILFQTGKMAGSSISQTLVKILREEGVAGWYRGNGASVLRVVPYAAFHFGAYEQFRTLLAKQLYGDEAARHHIPPWLDLLAGSAAGGAAVLMTYPLDLVRTRLAYGSERQGGGNSGAHPSAGPTTNKAASSLRRLHGYATAHSQDPPTTAGCPGSQTADARQARLVSGHSASSSGRQQSLQGEAGSGLPHRVSPEATALAGGGGGGKHSGMSRSTIRSVLAETVRIEGPAGLYRGIGPTLLGIVPYAGSKFFLYQTMKQKYWSLQQPPGLGQVEEPHKLPVWLMLSFGGVAGVVAQTMTYPLDVVRRHMQVQNYRGGHASGQNFTSTWMGLTLLYQQRGLVALFAGLSINYLKVVPATAIGFTVYDSAKQYLDLPQNL